MWVEKVVLQTQEQRYTKQNAFHKLGAVPFFVEAEQPKDNRVKIGQAWPAGEKLTFFNAFDILAEKNVIDKVKFTGFLLEAGYLKTTVTASDNVSGLHYSIETKDGKKTVGSTELPTLIIGGTFTLELIYASNVKSVTFYIKGVDDGKTVSDPNQQLNDKKSPVVGFRELSGQGPLAFSPDGRYLAVRSKVSDVTVLDATSGKVVAELKGAFKDKTEAALCFVTSLAFSPDGKVVAAGTNAVRDRSIPESLVHIWDVSTGKLTNTLRFITPEVEAISFFPDSATIVVGGGSRLSPVSLWDVKTGTPKGGKTSAARCSRRG